MPPIQTIARPRRNRISVPVPEEYGSYSFRVILVPLAPEASPSPKRREMPRIRDFIGYGRRFHPEYRSTEEVMRELREGED